MAIESDAVKQAYYDSNGHSSYYNNLFNSDHCLYKKNNFMDIQKMSTDFIGFNYSVHSSLSLSSIYFKCGNYDKSVYWAEKALALEPSCAEAHAILGSICYKKNDFKNTIDEYSKAIHIKPFIIDYWYLLIETHIVMNSKEKATQMFMEILQNNFFKSNLYYICKKFGRFLLYINNVKEAIKQYEIAKEEKPYFSDIWNDLGYAYFINNQLDKAIYHYEEALKIDPKLKNTLYNLGIVYSKLKEYEKSISTFQKFLQLCPEKISALENLAYAYRNKENIPSAIETYKKCLALDPNNVNINFTLGSILFKNFKNYEEAIKYLNYCLAINPKMTIVYEHLIQVYCTQGSYKNASKVLISLGDLHLDQNKVQNARSAYLCALHLDLENAHIHWKHGIALYRLRRYDLSLVEFKKAIELKPNFPNAYCDIALVYEKINPKKAIEFCEMALQLQPNHYFALHNLAILKMKHGLFEDVVEIYKKMLKHDNSDHYKLHIDLANIFHKKLNNLEQALFHYNKALEINNTNVEVYLNLGYVLAEMKRCDQAVRTFLHVTELDPQCFRASIDMGSVCMDSENYRAATFAFKSLHKKKPELLDVYCNLVQCNRHICDWSDYDTRISKLKNIVCEQLSNDEVPSLSPRYSLLYQFSPEVLKKIASKNAEQYIKKLHNTKKPLQDYVYQKTLSSNGCIRVGYVSSYFDGHPKSNLMQSIFIFHDTNKIEAFYYSLSSSDNSTSGFKMPTESDHFRDISNLEVIDAANRFNKDGIHILIDMNGYAKGARSEIFALRPAPIQALWLGYPGTSGAPFIDYLITNEICSPPELKHIYTEKLVYLKQSVYFGHHRQMFSDLQQRVFKNKQSETLNSAITMSKESEQSCCNELVSNNTALMYSTKILPDGTLKYYTRQMYNLPEDVIVFCNFSKPCKLNPTIFTMWANILNNVPSSVLWLLKYADIENNLNSFAKTLGIDKSRLIFSELVAEDEHIRRMQLADIFLDTPHYSSHLTCLDALWAGTPVVTLPGETISSRIAASQLTTLGFKWTIAEDESDYVNKATLLGLKKPILEQLKSIIWKLKTANKLFDCKSYTEELETAYNEMWSKFLSDNHSDTSSLICRNVFTKKIENGINYLSISSSIDTCL